MLGFEFTVVEPPALIDALRALSARVQRAADGSAPGARGKGAARERRRGLGRRARD
jgi:hypothetical protein